MRNATKQKKHIEVEKLELEKNTKRSSKKVEKTAATEEAAAPAESEEMKAQAKEENAAAAGANCENAEVKTEEVDQINKTLINTAKDRGRWALLEENYTMTSEERHEINARMRRNCHNIQRGTSME